MNFTICELKTKKVFCHAWHEGSRGVNELGTCVFKYLEDKSKDVNNPNLEIVLYSDDYGGQQKNKYMVGMYMFAVTRLPIIAITHKFLIKGHTQNKGDNAHPLIEEETKKCLNLAQFMYLLSTSQQYVQLKKVERHSKSLKCVMKIFLT